MLSFLLILLLIFFLWPLLSGGWRLWMQMRRMRRFMNDPFGTGARAGFRSKQSAQQQPPKKKKKIARDVGEYVAFTEVEAEQTSTNAADGSTRTDFVHEEQITDVKWVDIE